MTRMTGPECAVVCNLINTYIHCRESTGTGPVVLKVVPVTGAAFAGHHGLFNMRLSFPTPPDGMTNISRIPYTVYRILYTVAVSSTSFFREVAVTGPLRHGSNTQVESSKDHHLDRQ